MSLLAAWTANSYRPVPRSHRTQKDAALVDCMTADCGAVYCTAMLLLLLRLMMMMMLIVNSAQ